MTAFSISLHICNTTFLTVSRRLMLGLYIALLTRSAGLIMHDV